MEFIRKIGIGMDKLSAVIVSRNDHPTNNVRFLETVKNYVKHYDEVVYVDYGSDDPLHRVLIDELPKEGKLKCITVTKSDLVSLGLDPNIFVEVYARNIGIRRATGDFIVSTNQDIIADIPVPLDKGTMYTAPRREVLPGVFNQFVGSGNMLNELKKIKNGFKLQRNSTDENGNAIWDSGDIWSLVVCCGDYQIAHNSVWKKIRGFEESMNKRCYADSNIMKKASKFFNIDRLQLDVFHLNHPANTSCAYEQNDRLQYVNNFDETKNSETWGFSCYKFKEETI